MNSDSHSSILRQLVGHVLLMGVAGALAYEFAGFPRWVHATIFGIAAAAGAVLVAVSAWVSSRFDAILTDAAKQDDSVRVRGIFRYIAAARRELVVFLGIAAVGWLTSAGMSYLLFKFDTLTEMQFRWIAAVGYAGAVAVGLYSGRVGRLYLRLDSFRHELFEALAEEKQRVTLMKSLTPSALTPMNPSSGRVSGARRGRPT